MNNDVNGVSILYMVSNEGIVGKDESSWVFENFDEDGGIVKLIEFGLYFPFELGYWAVD